MRNDTRTLQHQTVRALGAIVIATLFFSFVSATSAGEDAGELWEPAGLLLSWQRDPLTTMTIDWHTVPEDADRPTEVVFWLLDSNERQTQDGKTLEYPYSDRAIRRVELTNLTPGATYEFQLGPGARTYRFRTMPKDLTQPVRIAAGGDVRHSKALMLRTNRVAASHDPHFVLWGGDLAYADGREDRIERWYEFFEATRDGLITDEGRLIPVVVTIGNHEVLGGYLTRHEEYEQTDAWRKRIAPYYYAFFAFPGQPGYAALDFGSYLSLLALDTGHTNPIAGAQTEWLEKALDKRGDVTHVVPFYHVPAYPSHRPFGGAGSRRVREHWVPLFERNNVRVAFEHHDHTYKRTWPIRGGEVSPEDGIVYIGDGAWGVGTREGSNKDEWYIARFASVRHIILVTLHGEHQYFRAIDERGNVIDEYPEAPERRE